MAGHRAGAGGAWLSRWDGASVQRLLGAPMVALHRADLHRILRAPLPTETLRTGVEITGVERAPDGRLRVTCTTPADVDEADLVVAADGIDSVLRTQLWPDVPAPAYTGLTTWRGIAPAPAGPPLETAQSWGRGAEFGIVPLADGRVYWFGTWHRPIPDLIDASDVVLHHDIYHLPALPESFVRERVVLLGDAAHAMPPHLGQGGCQALEDAVVLADALVRTPDVDGALARYDRQRRPRTAAVARSAGQVGRLNALTNPIAVAARNTMVRLTPSIVGVRSMARFGRWEPPSGSA